MPVTPWVGYKPWTWVRSHQYVGYTSIWNLLDYASLAMPVTVVDADKDRVDTDVNVEYWRKHVPRNESDEFNYRQCECPGTKCVLLRGWVHVLIEWFV